MSTLVRGQDRNVARDQLVGSLGWREPVSFGKLGIAELPSLPILLENLTAVSNVSGS